MDGAISNLMVLPFGKVEIGQYDHEELSAPISFFSGRKQIWHLVLVTHVWGSLNVMQGLYQASYERNNCMCNIFYQSGIAEIIRVDC